MNLDVSALGLDGIGQLRCPDCDHFTVAAEHACGDCRRCRDVDWQFTSAREFPVDDVDVCAFVGPGDDCSCHFCARFDADAKRQATERFWRSRIAAEQMVIVSGDAERPDGSPRGFPVAVS